jgi:hypothetical protein
MTEAADVEMQPASPGLSARLSSPPMVSSPTLDPYDNFPMDVDIGQIAEKDMQIWCNPGPEKLAAKQREQDCAIDIISPLLLPTADISTSVTSLLLPTARTSATATSPIMITADKGKARALPRPSPPSSAVLPMSPLCLSLGVTSAPPPANQADGK